MKSTGKWYVFRPNGQDEGMVTYLSDAEREQIQKRIKRVTEDETDAPFYLYEMDHGGAEDIHAELKEHEEEIKTRQVLDRVLEVPDLEIHNTKLTWDKDAVDLYGSDSQGAVVSITHNRARLVKEIMKRIAEGKSMPAVLRNLCIQVRYGEERPKPANIEDNG